MIAALLTAAYVPISPPRVPQYSCGRAPSIVLPRNSHRSLVLQAESGDEKKTFLNVLRDGYKEGYEAGQKYLSTPMRSSVTDPNAAPLRAADKIAAILLTVVLVETIAFGGATSIAWLIGTAAASGLAQARLFAAVSAAASFRAATRLPRLLAECVALPYVMRRIESRSTELRATYVKDRASQTIAVFGVLLLTLRAFNAGALSGTTGAAGAVLLEKVASVSAPLGDLIDSVAGLVWAGATRIGARLVAIDAAARQTPINAAFYAVADSEKVLEPVGKLVVAALAAFLEDVVKPILKTLGFITVQTLG